MHQTHKDGLLCFAPAQLDSLDIYSPDIHLFLLEDSSQASNQSQALEKGVILQLGTLLTVYHELVQTALPAGSCVDTLLRSLSKTYAILTSLIKHVSVLCWQWAASELKTSPPAAASSQWPLAAARLRTGLLISWRSWALVLLAFMPNFMTFLSSDSCTSGDKRKASLQLNLALHGLELLFPVCAVGSSTQLCAQWRALTVFSQCSPALPLPLISIPWSRTWGNWAMKLHRPVELLETRWWLPQSSPLTALECRHGIWDITSHWGRCLCKSCPPHCAILWAALSSAWIQDGNSTPRRNSFFPCSISRLAAAAQLPSQEDWKSWWVWANFWGNGSLPWVRSNTSLSVCSFTGEALRFPSDPTVLLIHYLRTGKA